MKTLKFKIGDEVMVTGNIYQSANGTLLYGRAEKEISKIRKAVIKAAHPYAIDGIDGWFDQDSVRLYIKPTVEVGDIVRLIRMETYNHTPIKLSPYLVYEIKEIDKDVATIYTKIGKTFKANVYNLKKVD